MKQTLITHQIIKKWKPKFSITWVPDLFNHCYHEHMLSCECVIRGGGGVVPPMIWQKAFLGCVSAQNLVIYKDDTISLRHYDNFDTTVLRKNQKQNKAKEIPWRRSWSQMPITVCPFPCNRLDYREGFFYYNTEPVAGNYYPINSRIFIKVYNACLTHWALDHIKMWSGTITLD